MLRLPYNIITNDLFLFLDIRSILYFRGICKKCIIYFNNAKLAINTYINLIYLFKNKPTIIEHLFKNQIKDFLKIEWSLEICFLLFNYAYMNKNKEIMKKISETLILIEFEKIEKITINKNYKNKNICVFKTSNDFWPIDFCIILSLIDNVILLEWAIRSGCSFYYLNYYNYIYPIKIENWKKRIIDDLNIDKRWFNNNTLNEEYCINNINKIYEIDNKVRIYLKEMYKNKKKIIEYKTSEEWTLWESTYKFI